jgi:hypothetical protein
MMMRRFLIGALISSALGACTMALDFDDVENLPCPCDQDHVCLIAADRCVKRASVDTYKSCDLGAERPDDLCKPNEICESINGVGRRCLPTCEVSNYATPTAAQNIAFECAPGKTCWESERGIGVCSEGICSELADDCPPPQKCTAFNGAGVCFTPCRIFLDNPACGGTQICQPIGAGSVTACIDSGQGNIGDVCDDMTMCKPDDGSPQRRPLVCDEPAGSMEMVRHCRAICECPVGAGCQQVRCNTGAACVEARPNVDTERNVGLGICLE